MVLETIIGNLRDGFNQLEPGTMLHADQLMTEQVTNVNLRSQAYYVADGVLYSLEGEKKLPTLWVTRLPNNLTLRHLNDEVNSSYNQLVNTGNFLVDPQEARKAMRAKDTLRIALTKLHLQGDNLEYQFVEISTTDYDKELNAEDRKLAERWYGQGKVFVTAMETLKEANINNTRISLLNPDFVQKIAKEGPVGRAAWRDYFNYNAYSDASERGVSSRSGVRGVRRMVAPQGHALKNSAVPSVTVTPQEIRLATFDKVRAYSASFVPEIAREQFEAGLRKLYNL